MKVCFPQSPKEISALLLRLSFGVSLLLVGLTHYMTIEPFKAMTADGLGPLEPVGTLWAFILPGLMVVGGALLVIGKYLNVAAWTAGLALASIPVGMLLKPVLSGASLGDMMPAAVNAFVWLIVYFFVVKCSCCGSCETQK